MADVSLDDLIQKDKQKNKVDRLRQVPPPSSRNSRPRNLSAEVDPPITKIEATEGKETLSLKSTDLLKNVLRPIAMLRSQIGPRKIFRRSDRRDPSPLLRKRKTERRSSAP